MTSHGQFPAACWFAVRPLSLNGVHVLAIIGCLGEFVVATISNHSFLWNRELSFTRAAAFFGLHGLTWLTLATGLQASLRWATQGRRTAGQAFLARFAVSILLTVAAWFYLFAWVFQFRTGLFPDRDTLRFATTNARPLAEYFWQFEPRNASLLLAACTGITCVTTTVVWGKTRFHFPAAARDGSFFRSLLLMTLWLNSVWACGLYAAAGRQASVTDVQRLTAPWPNASFEFRFHITPLVTLASDFFLVSTDIPAGDIPAAALVPRVAPEVRRHLVSDNEDAVPQLRRSVILITIESLRSDVIGFQHQGRAVMPCLNELARTGAFFSRCYSQSTHSDYSDPAILSSLYPLRTPHAYVYQSRSPWPVVRIYDRLGPAGYATAMFSSQNEAWSNMHRFYESPFLDLMFDARTPGEQTYAFGEMRDWTRLTGMVGKLDDAATATAALKWIDSHQQRQRPFFLSLNFQTSHFPYRRPDGQEGPFHPAGVSTESTLLSHDPKQAEQIRNSYFNALHYVDTQLNRIVAACTRADQSQPLFVITGDHGEAFGENGVAGHGGAPLETTSRVGLVLWCPERIAPRVDDYLVQAVDIGPTILGALELAPCPAFQGVDVLSPSRPVASRRLAFIHCKTSIASTDCILTGDGWRLTRNRLGEIDQLCFRPSDRVPEPELSGRFPEVATALRGLLDEWRRRQLLYYANQRYYGFFYPPQSPEMDEAITRLLSVRP